MNISLVGGVFSAAVACYYCNTSLHYVLSLPALWLTSILIAGFEQAIQAYAVHVLSLTYQKVPRSVLAEVCFKCICVPCNAEVFFHLVSVPYDIIHVAKYVLNGGLQLAAHINCLTGV